MVAKQLWVFSHRPVLDLREKEFQCERKGLLSCRLAEQVLGSMVRVAHAEAMDKTMATRSATSMDKAVGRNIRSARLARGLSQSSLAEKLGITFQQVQKYEKGVNRVGSGRLFEIGSILGVPVTSFFEQANAPPAAKGTRSVPRTDPLSIRLVQAFAKLPDSKSRLALVTVVESMTRMRRE